MRGCATPCSSGSTRIDARARLCVCGCAMWLWRRPPLSSRSFSSLFCARSFPHTHTSLVLSTHTSSCVLVCARLPLPHPHTHNSRGVCLLALAPPHHPVRQIVACRPLLRRRLARSATCDEATARAVGAAFVRFDAGAKGYLTRHELRCAHIALLGHAPSRTEFDAMAPKGACGRRGRAATTQHCRDRAPTAVRLCRPQACPSGAGRGRGAPFAALTTAPRATSARQTSRRRCGASRHTYCGAHGIAGLLRSTPRATVASATATSMP